MQGTLMGFVPITDPDRARDFYVNVLKLEFVTDDGFAVIVKYGANQIRLTRTPDFKPAPFTILGWQVADVRGIVQELASAGVAFNRYSFLQQDDAGIWTSPNQVMVAWFQDPDGNVLSLSQHP